MEKYTYKETSLINSLNKPIDNIDMILVNSIVNKMIKNGEYNGLLNFLNNLYDYAKLPKNIVDKLILENNKDCIAEFLDNEEILYFLNLEEKNKLKKYLNACEVNIKLDNTFDYYYKKLYKQGIRIWRNNTIKNNNKIIIEHLFTQYNKIIKLKLIEVKDIGVIASCVIYSNYYLPKEEQIFKGIDYINEFEFNIDKDINNKNILFIFSKM